ncbi:MAG: hypothetical protein M5U34_33725 [Chloroflexi bacterium]|nr:hypothetical protein [Chloroflexota bacterium]
MLGLGLLVRAFFDALGNATNQIPIKIWYIILVFFVLQATSAITKLISVYADVTYRSIIAALLRKNMFQYVLRQPGADALPYSATRAITHFRNDTMEITRILSTLGVIEAIAATVFTIFSLIILLKN